MFEVIFKNIETETGITITQGARVFLHYGAVRSINVTVNCVRLRREKLSREEVSINLSRLLTRLKELRVDVEGIEGTEDLSKLIEFIAEDNGVPWNTEGVNYLNKTITASVGKVAADAAREAKDKGIREVAAELIQKVVRHLKMKPDFLC